MDQRTAPPGDSEEEGPDNAEATGNHRASRQVQAIVGAAERAAEELRVGSERRAAERIAEADRASAERVNAAEAEALEIVAEAQRQAAAERDAATSEAN